LRDYNGFTGSQRTKAQGWLNRNWAAGTFARPDRCCACDQTEGVIDAHAEDYSEPFTYGKLMRYPLCFVCHMMVHCRHRDPKRWALYCRLIGEGWMPPAYLTRNFPRFQKQFLNPAGLPTEGWEQHAVPYRRPLDGITLWLSRQPVPLPAPGDSKQPAA
jgi:hypothetical protein